MGINRQPYIDMAKGIGIILVVLGHANYSSFLVKWQCSFFIALFFICSGMCYSGPKPIKTTIKKLLFPYCAWGFLGELLYILLDVLNSSFDLRQSISNLLKFLLGMTQRNYPLWFLAAFCSSKIVFDLIQSGTQKVNNGKYRELTGLLLSSCCFVLGIVLGTIKVKYSFFFPFRLDIGLTMVPFFLVGTYFIRLKKHFDGIAHIGKAVCIASAFLLNFVAFKLNPIVVSVNSSEYGNPLLFLISSVFGSLFVIELCYMFQKQTIIRTVFSWYGKNSMTIMCVHALILPFIIKAMSFVQRMNMLNDSVMNYVVFFICVLLMYPLCKFRENFVAKIKLRDYQY